jgi:hypothetical protein
VDLEEDSGAVWRREGVRDALEPFIQHGLVHGGTWSKRESGGWRLVKMGSGGVSTHPKMCFGCELMA